MIARLLCSSFSPVRNRLARRRVAKRRPATVRGPESLESRTVMAVFTVVPPTAPVSAVNFRSLQEALAAAASTGDTIRISPNAIIDTFDVSTKLSANAPIGSTKITAPVSVPFGQEIKLQDAMNSEFVVVVGSQPAAGGLVELTLKSPLVNAFSTAGSGTSIQTTDNLAITKSVTLTSINGMLPATISNPSEIQVFADNVIFRNLLIGSTVTLMPDADGTFFRNCMLSDVSDTAIGNSGGRTFTDNVFFGDLTLREDGDPATFDRVLFNQFRDCSLRLVNGNDDANIRGNVFDMVGADTAIDIDRGTGVVVRQNAITFANPAGPGNEAFTDGSIGIYVRGGGTADDAVLIQLLNNSIDTGGRGIGIALANNGVDGTNYFKAKVQGNDFHWNTIGLLVDGSGETKADDLGVVDLGGGTLGSLGANNFRGFTTAAAAAGTAFSIYLANDNIVSTQHLPSQNNLWSTNTPNLTVKDSANQSDANGWVWGKGVGSAGVGSSQLSGNQQFVQSLFNEFLGRSGTSIEVDAWSTKLDSSTLTKQQVATGIITSEEAYGYYVDGLYHSILQRSADTAGRSGWISQLKAGASKESVAAGMTASDEYFSRLSLMSLDVIPLPVNRTGGVGDEAYVTSLYQKYLQRLPTNAEVSSWLAAGPMTSSRRLSTAQSILTSSEFRTVLVQDDLYYRMLNRRTPPSSAEVQSWVDSGLLLTQLQIAFASSNEYFQFG